MSSRIQAAVGLAVGELLVEVAPERPVASRVVVRAHRPPWRQARSPSAASPRRERLVRVISVEPRPAAAPARLDLDPGGGRPVRRPRARHRRRRLRGERHDRRGARPPVGSRHRVQRDHRVGPGQPRAAGSPVAAPGVPAARAAGRGRSSGSRRCPKGSASSSTPSASDPGHRTSNGMSQTTRKTPTRARSCLPSARHRPEGGRATRGRGSAGRT